MSKVPGSTRPFDLDEFILDWFSPVDTKPKYNGYFFCGHEPQWYLRPDDEQDALEWLYIANVFERVRLAGIQLATITIPIEALRAIFVSARRGGLPNAPELEPERLIKGWDQLSLGFKLIVADYGKKGLHKAKAMRKPALHKLRMDIIVRYACNRKEELQNEVEYAIDAEAMAVAEARSFGRIYGLNIGKTYIQKLMGSLTDPFDVLYLDTPQPRARRRKS